MPNAPHWTPETVAMVERMWRSEAASASEIARAATAVLGRPISRAAVLSGAWRRWGPKGAGRAGGPTRDATPARESRDPPALERRAREANPALTAASAAKPSAPREAADGFKARRDNHRAGPLAATFINIGRGGCLWWVGPDVEPDAQLFCGEARAAGTSYCEGHAAIAGRMRRVR